MRKTWFITGAGRGIGAHIAHAAIAAGDHVVAAGRSLAQLTSTFDGVDPAQLALVELDVAREAQAVAAVQAAVARFGRIDVLVNNAAYGLLGNFEELSPHDIEQQFSVNVYGVMHVLRAALPVLRGQRAGHVINISSIAGVTGFDGASVYCATKYAIEGLSASLALELDKFGIKVTSVEPGFFRTDFLDQSSVRYGAKVIDDYAAHGSVAHAYGAYHGKQLGDPARLAAAVVRIAAMAHPPKQFLAGSDALAMANTTIDARMGELAGMAELSRSTDHAA
ncbi:SDR family NAD(P)-dependent oxidoreductase [Massilia yuzhufengensis]|uniref:NADP-dependent 3-hydroxy acid dehydrogenase YdfG n=1 Tax=Massilia yuzhufengensis TaxID=1164594 RepID=A0A1I1RJV4_9BURK|nr:SDR family NAD(P)-dependent oxidoreductase [Massilia yuzhufengensis]SFD31913.1 NADP-dependent 3-hydroxy acid dehydrogenase YdfG [Massilia yuzhufengensis]